MDNKWLLLLAFDSLLSDLDKDYDSVSEEQLQLIRTKIYEGYGFKVTSSKEDLKKINGLLIQDIKKYRRQILEEM